MTREEQYLAKIAGEETDIPNNPILRSEQYLAKIAGEDVEIPEKPLLNEETYLAILAGEDYEIPAPYNRIEQYMAKACGLEINVPSPLTRVEQLWAQIVEGGSWTVTKITGTLPLTFLSKGDDLIDYRIYGTSEGSGVETENLFDKDRATLGKYINSSNVEVVSSASGEFNKLNHSGFIKITAGQDYTLKCENAGANTCSFCWYSQNKELLDRPIFDVINTQSIYIQTFTAPLNAEYLIINYCTTDQSTVMLTPGSTVPSTYIPHGYKLPLTVESGAQSQDIPIYIGFSKLGEEEFVDFGEQKVYKLSADLWDVNGTTTNNAGAERPGNEFEAGKTYFVTNTAPSGTIYYRIGISSQTSTRLADGTLEITPSDTLVIWMLNTTPMSYISVKALMPTDPPVPLPPIPTYKGENTLSSTETLGEVTVKGRIKEAVPNG